MRYTGFSFCTNCDEIVQSVVIQHGFLNIEQCPYCGGGVEPMIDCLACGTECVVDTERICDSCKNETIDRAREFLDELCADEEKEFNEKYNHFFDYDQVGFSEGLQRKFENFACNLKEAQLDYFDERMDGNEIHDICR